MFSHPKVLPPWPGWDAMSFARSWVCWHRGVRPGTGEEAPGLVGDAQPTINVSSTLTLQPHHCRVSSIWQCMDTSFCCRSLAAMGTDSEHSLSQLPGTFRDSCWNIFCKTGWSQAVLQGRSGFDEVLREPHPRSFLMFQLLLGVSGCMDGSPGCKDTCLIMSLIPALKYPRLAWALYASFFLLITVALNF